MKSLATVTGRVAQGRTTIQETATWRCRVQKQLSPPSNLCFQIGVAIAMLASVGSSAAVAVVIVQCTGTAVAVVAVAAALVQMPAGQVESTGAPSIGQNIRMLDEVA